MVQKKKKKPGQVVPTPVEEKKKPPKSKKEAEKQAAQELHEEEMLQKKEEYKAELKAQKELEEKLKKTNPYVGVNLKKNPELDEVLGKCVYAFENKAAADDVVNIMIDLQYQINIIPKTSKEDARALSVILMKMAARKPEAWKSLKQQAMKEGKKAGIYTQTMLTVEEAMEDLIKQEKIAKVKTPKQVIEIQHKGISPAEIDDALETYRRLPEQSMLTNEEMMRTIGVMEHTGAIKTKKGVLVTENEAPLEITKKWLGLDDLKKKKAIDILEEAELLVELNKRGTVSAEYLTKHAHAIEDNLYSSFPEKMKIFKTTFSYVLASETLENTDTLDEAIYYALKREEMDPVLGKYSDLIDKSDNLADFMKKLDGDKSPAAKEFLEELTEMRTKFEKPFKVRTTLLKVASPQMGKKYIVMQEARGELALKIFPSLQKGVIMEKIALFGTVVAEKTYLPGAKIFGKWGNPKKASSWRPKAFAVGDFIKKNKIAFGVLTAAAVLAYAGYEFLYKKPTKKKIAQLRKDFKKDFKTEFPLSDKAIMYYYGTDEGKRMLAELESMYPTPATIKNLMEQDIATKAELKTNYLDMAGILLHPDKFDKALLLLMNEAKKTPNKEPEEIVNDTLESLKDKGYVMTVGENFIINYCATLGIKKEKEFKKKPEKKGVKAFFGKTYEKGLDIVGLGEEGVAKEYKGYEYSYDYTYDKSKYFIKNEKAFVKMWDFINSGKLPRSKAKEYAKIAFSNKSYKEKKKELNKLLLKTPIVKDSLMDVLDQYALVSGDFAAYYEELLETYKTDSTAQENLNNYMIKEGDAIYGNLFGLMAFADEVAKHGVTEDTDPSKGLISGDVKFKNEKGKIEKKHYWVRIGDDSIMKFLPSISSNEKELNFLLKYSGVDEMGNSTGMLKWFMDNRERLKREAGPSQVIKFFMLSKNLLNENYYNEDTGKYNYPWVESFLNKKIPALEDKNMWYGIDVPFAPYEIPTDKIPKGEMLIEVSSEKGKTKKIAIDPQLIKDSEGLLEYINGAALPSFKKTKEYKFLTNPKKGGYTKEELQKFVGDAFLYQITLARNGDDDGISFLQNAGIELDEETNEINIVDPEKVDKVIKKDILLKEYNKLK